MKWFRRLLAVFLVLVSTVTVGIYLFAQQQGRLSADFGLIAPVTVKWDSDGIPTLEAPDWARLIEAQGFVVASERLFQMDLMRRSASGRLSEWFGGHPSAIDWDRGRRLEDWQTLAEAIASKMPEDDRAWCDAYARGVNKFIDSMNWKWGIEYVVLMQRPETWQCSDSVLVLMSLVDDLSRTAEKEVWTTVWKEHIPKDWFEFLYPQDHPWNVPLFGTNPKGLRAPTQKLPARDVDETLLAESVPTDTFSPGSNSWYWAGKTGAFLANDPHLGMTVPQIWFANRLRVNAADWVVGASVPGMPGVVLGRNPHVAWAFTNSLEDVDDLLEEELSADGKSYAVITKGKKTFQPIREKEYEIRVRNDKPVLGIARFTHRGPLLNYASLGKDRNFSRQWLGFFPERMGLPVRGLNQAKSLEDMDKAIDRFQAPAQSILIADNDGNLEYRLSGSGVIKTKSSLFAVPASEGEWKGFQPPSQRKKKILKRNRQVNSPLILGLANQRIYADPLGHHWSSDVRIDRIDKVLRSSPTQTMETMQALQLDTHSRYLKLFTDWLMHNAKSEDPTVVRIQDAWKKWDGMGKSDPVSFHLAVEAHRQFSRVLMGQIRKSLLPKELSHTVYNWKDSNAWMVYLLENEATFTSLGLNPSQLAHFVMKKVTDPTISQPYPDTNRWHAQHPMAAAVPLLGSWLQVDEHPQWGFEGLVRVERERSGASLRVVWDMDQPRQSEWTFPVGQSGHVASKHYKDFRKQWFAEKMALVFPLEYEWKFSPINVGSKN